MKLPLALEPWRVWLALFPPKMIDAMGELLLRLDPLVGRLNCAVVQADDTPAGIGSIVRRGSYERMLMSEWAYADAAPDEFLRRAANGELLFLGPEPQARRRAGTCVVLFDCGPAQLGAPRLAHLALFILLARRAEEAGAALQWGSLQQPGGLRGEVGLAGLQRLLKGRMLAVPSAAHVAAWDAWMAQHHAGLSDFWVVAGALDGMPQRATARLAVTHEFLAEQLSVTLVQRHATRTLSLALPPERVGVRLIRDPFAPLASPARATLAGRPSMKQAPRFSADGKALLVAGLDGGIMCFGVPGSTTRQPGKVRLEAAPATGQILAAGVFNKTLVHLAADGGELAFSGFSIRGAPRRQLQSRPEMAQFHAPNGLGRWLQLFFLAATKPSFVRRIVVVDINKQLVCWENKHSITGQPSSVLKVLAKPVLGIQQFGNELLYAAPRGHTTVFYHWPFADDLPSAVLTLKGPASKVLIGNLPDGAGGRMLALQRGEQGWWAGDLGSAHAQFHPGAAGLNDWWTTAQASGQLIQVGQGETVAGIACGGKNGAEVGLVVLMRDRRTIQFCTAKGRRELVQTPTPITQLAVDPMRSRLAWLTHTPVSLTVLGLDEPAPLLHVNFTGADDAA